MTDLGFWNFNTIDLNFKVQLCQVLTLYCFESRHINMTHIHYNHTYALRIKDLMKIILLSWVYLE